MSDAPLAYLITFTTYGTHLHGDPRGSVHHSGAHFGEPGIESNASWQGWDAGRLKNRPQKLDGRQRDSARNSISRVAQVRGWDLLTVNVRTNHIHLVISGNSRPELMMTALKGWITRDLVAAGLLEPGVTLWTRHGSTRYLFNEVAVEAACRYVRDGQGADIPGSVMP